MSKKINSKANKMLEILNGKGRKFIVDDDNQLHHVNSKESQEYLVTVDSEEFKEDCLCEFYTEYEDTIDDSAYRRALSTFKGIKRKESDERVPLKNRVAFHDSAIWHQLSEGNAVKISKEGVSLTDGVPLVFNRYPHQESLPKPTLDNGSSHKENLDLIFDYANIRDANQRLLFKVSLVFGLIPDVPHPIDLIVGPAGSAKTTTSQIKKSLIDPVASLKGFSVPGREDDFLLMASQHHVVPFDNMPLIKNRQSDMFCKAVTGDATSKRKLYTDNIQLLYRVKCCLVINGIDIPTTKSDFLDRCLLFQLERIPGNERKEEASLYSDFNDKKPIILGATYQILSKAMEIHEDLKIDKLPRMADFAKWGCAITQAMGYDEKDFIKAYAENRKLISKEIIQSYSLLDTVISFMSLSDEDEVIKTPSALYSILMKHAISVGIDTTWFPTNATWLSRNLIAEAHILEEGGISVSVDKKGDRRIILRKLVSYRPKVTDINPATVLDNSCLQSPENLDRIKQCIVDFLEH